MRLNDYKIEHIKKPSGITNSPYNMIPHLPDCELFFDSRHWTYGLVENILPFSLTSRISANNQQFLKIIEKEGFMKETKTIYAKNHHLNREKKRNKTGWLHEDIPPTVTTNEYKGVGNIEDGTKDTTSNEEGLH